MLVGVHIGADYTLVLVLSLVGGHWRQLMVSLVVADAALLASEVRQVARLEVILTARLEVLQGLLESARHVLTLGDVP